MSGGADADSIFGGNGNDSLFGDDGADLIYGNVGADVISGGAGADTIYGGGSNDQIVGGAGNDTIWGNLGNDTVLGGTGADRFELRGSFGNDTITDFNVGESDLIAVDTGVTLSYADNSTSTRVEFNSGDSVVLIHNGFTFADVSGGSFFGFV
jgi:Ca2+-binding RTX toxin-like protein